MSQRYPNQIRNLLEVFGLVEVEFQRRRPIDVYLTRHFRANGKFGSRDRKFISNAIFGYYRWYGWLREIEGRGTEFRLLLAYLLENGPVTDLIRFWSRQVGLDSGLLTAFGCDGKLDFDGKFHLLKRFYPHLSPNRLNPEFVPSWTAERIVHFQTRPNLWVRSVGSQCDGLKRFLQERSVDYSVHPGCPHSIEIKKSLSLKECDDFQSGEIEIQDISSQAVGLICAPRPEDCWWDVCAGSGGKSLHLASLMRGTGIVYATDVRKGALKELKRRNRRKRFTIVARHWDGENVPNFHHPLDGILVDAPCSCSGTWRRAPELRWNTTLAMVREYAAMQLRILSNAARAYPQVPVIVYATCSVFPEENEQVVSRFLERFPAYSPTSITNPLTGAVSDGSLHLGPPELNGNSTFVARLARK